MRKSQGQKAHIIHEKSKYLVQQAHDCAFSAIGNISELDAWNPGAAAEPEILEAEEHLRKALALLRKAGALPGGA